MTTNLLINALRKRYNGLENIEIEQGHTEGEARYTEEPYC